MAKWSWELKIYCWEMACVRNARMHVNCPCLSKRVKLRESARAFCRVQLNWPPTLKQGNQGVWISDSETGIRNPKSGVGIPKPKSGIRNPESNPDFELPVHRWSCALLSMPGFDVQRLTWLWEICFSNKYETNSRSTLFPRWYCYKSSLHILVDNHIKTIYSNRCTLPNRGGKFLKKLGAASVGVLQDNLVLSTELTM